MKTKKLLSVLSAAAVSATMLSGLAVTASAAISEPSYGGTLLRFTSDDDVTVGSGSYETSGCIGSTHVDNSLNYAEFTLPALGNDEDVANYDTVIVNMGTNADNKVDIDVMIGNTVVAEFDNVSTGSWSSFANTASLNEAYASADFTSAVTLRVTKTADNTGNYLGNYYSVEFYNSVQKIEDEVADEAFDIEDVILANEITRVDHAANFGTLQNIMMTNEESYPEKFGTITDYTTFADYTDGDDYFYINVTEAGQYSFALLSENSAGTTMKFEKLTNGKFSETNTITATVSTVVASCEQKGSNSGEFESGNLRVYLSDEINLNSGYYKVTLDGTEGSNYYTNLVAITGIKNISEPETLEATTVTQVSKSVNETGNAAAAYMATFTSENTFEANSITWTVNNKDVDVEAGTATDTFETPITITANGGSFVFGLIIDAGKAGSDGAAVLDSIDGVKAVLN